MTQTLCSSFADDPTTDATAFDVVVEIAAGGEPIKYELDKATTRLRVDRFLHTAMRYPCNYDPASFPALSLEMAIRVTHSLSCDPCDAASTDRTRGGH